MIEVKKDVELSKDEKFVVDCLNQGMSTSKIAKQLGVKRKKVNNDITLMREKGIAIPDLRTMFKRRGKKMVAKEKPVVIPSHLIVTPDQQAIPKIVSNIENKFEFVIRNGQVEEILWNTVSFKLRYKNE
jgi:transposase